MMSTKTISALLASLFFVNCRAELVLPVSKDDIPDGCFFEDYDMSQHYNHKTALDLTTFELGSGCVSLTFSWKPEAWYAAVKAKTAQYKSNASAIYDNGCGSSDTTYDDCEEIAGIEDYQEGDIYSFFKWHSSEANGNVTVADWCYPNSDVTVLDGDSNEVYAGESADNMDTFHIIEIFDETADTLIQDDGIDFTGKYSNTSEGGCDWFVMKKDDDNGFGNDNLELQVYELEADNYYYLGVGHWGVHEYIPGVNPAYTFTDLDDDFRIAITFYGSIEFDDDDDYSGACSATFAPAIAILLVMSALGHIYQA